MSSLPKGKEKKGMILSALREAEVEPNRRGESLSIKEFGLLSDALYPFFNSAL